jgi:long-chain acyl-CoA synthetase
VKQAMMDWWGPVLWEYYAGTELNGFCLVKPDEWLARPGTVGKPLIGEIHILGADGEELPAGEAGTVYFGGGPAYEYHNDPEKTRDVADPGGHGWTTLGDVGYVDDDGWLFLTDRKAFMIISGGVNIYPQETENVLTMHPKIIDVAVIGVPNDEMGEEVKAVVQLADPTEAGPDLEQELLAYCRERLAHYKCPRTIDFEDELPRLPTGKLYKRVLRDRYWEGHDSHLL